MPTAKILQWVPGVDLSNPPDYRLIDYKRGLNRRLYQHIETWFRGEVREVSYFAQAAVMAPGPIQYSDLILRVSLVYTRGETGLVRDRVVTRTWYDTDGNPMLDNPLLLSAAQADPTPGNINLLQVQKVTHKVYDPELQLEEGRRRRKNVMNGLTVGIATVLTVQGSVAGGVAPGDQAGAELVGYLLLQPLGAQIGLYQDFGDPSLRTAIAASSTSWLDDVVSVQAAAIVERPMWAGMTLRAVVDEELKVIVEP